VKPIHWLLLFLCGLSVAILEAGMISKPGTMDACYYAQGGQAIAQGRGNEERFLWNYLDQPSEIPQPSFSYWMPLASLLASLGFLLPPGGFREGQLPFILLAACFPIFVAWLASRWNQPPRIAFTAGLFAVFSGFYTVYWVNFETFLLYAWIGGFFFFTVTHFQGKHSGWALFFTGVLCGLAHLTRADGLLFTGLAILCLLTFGSLRFRQRLAGIFTILAGYAIVTGIWYIRNLLVFGWLFPPGNAYSLWLVTYNDLFHFPAAELTAERFFSSGWMSMLSTRWDAFLWNGQTLIFVMGLVFLAPFIAAGFLHLRRKSAFRMAVVYFGVLFVVMTVVFPLQGSRGGFFHSSAAGLSMLAISCAVGLDSAIAWLSLRRHWDPTLSRWVLTVGIIVFAAMASTTIFINRVIGPDLRTPTWARTEEYRLHIIPFVDMAAADQLRFMVNNPPCFNLETGFEAIPIPDGGMDNLLSAADYYRAEYLVLDGNTQPQMRTIFEGDSLDPRLKKLSEWETSLGRLVLFSILKEE
jgi:hypothetical protein